METLSDFLPMDRRAALAGGYSLHDRTSGAALFADISGFTPMTAALAEAYGADRGAEELTGRLNIVFGALIDQVHTYRGSIIGFSGDAITCWFDSDDGRRAVTVALAMQEVIGDLNAVETPDGRDTAVGIKVAVACGPARRFLAGTDSIPYVEVLAGSILDRTATGEKLASQGEVVVSEEVREFLGEDLEILTERRDEEANPYFIIGGMTNPAEPSPWPKIPSLPVETMRHWILPAVYQRLELGEGQFVSELRQATAVFLKFSGIDYDGDDEAGQKLDAFLCWVQSILKRYDASLGQVTLGDKGSYVMLVFGAPVAHEDDTVRALSAALELREPPSDLEYIRDIQIGVNRGLIHAGTYGGSGSLTYGILGDATNVAARLMGQADPGQVLIPSRMVKAVEKDFEFLELDRLLLKGLMGPIALASLEGRLDTDRSAASLWSAAQDKIIGRSEEWSTIEDVLREVVDGESRVLIIEGEAGIGKSAMVADLRGRALQLGIELFQGDGDAIEQSSPYFAWRNIIRAAINGDMKAASSVAAMKDAVIARLQSIDPQLVDLAPLLNTILAVDFPENELTRAMVGEVRAENLNRLLATVLSTRTLVSPLAIILDDAHWLDSASWALARHVQRDVAPLLLVIALRRSDRPVPEFLHLRQLPSSTLLTLDLLSSEEILAIASRRLGVEILPEPVAKLILEKAEGHPFYGEELAYALRDSGHIRVNDGRAEMVTAAVELERLAFPDTIQGVITSRIDKVTARQQLILKVASVIGRVFAYAILHDIDPVQESNLELRDDLEVLRKLDITPLETPDPELTYLFRHIMTQEVAYGLLTFAQRKMLHQAAAEWYESNQSAQLESVYPLLASHWIVAEKPEKSIPYSLQAGQQALDSGAFSEAIKHFSDGLELNESAGVIKDAAELAEWYFRKGTAHRNFGEVESSFDSLMAALNLLGQPYPSGQVRFLGSLLGQIGRQVLHRLAPRFFDGRAREEDYPLLVAGIYEMLTHVFFYQNQMIASVYCILRHLNLAEEARPSPQRARSYGTMTYVAGVAGLHNQAEVYLRLAQEALNEDELIPDQDLVYIYLAIYFAGVGRWEENEAHCLKAAEITEKIGNMRRWTENISCLALTTLWRGDIERSSSLSRQVLEGGAREGDHQLEVWGNLEQAEIAVLHGDLDEAARLLAEAESIAEGLGLADQIWLYGLIGVTMLRVGNKESAAGAVEKAQEAISAAPPSTFYLTAPISGMIEVNVALWRESPHDETLKKSVKKTIGVIKNYARAFPIARPRSYLWQGIFKWHNKNEDKARKAWMKGIECARDLEMPYDEGLLLLALGTSAGREAHAREADLKAAREIFAGLDATYDLEWLAALSQ